MHDEVARRALARLAHWLLADAFPVWSQRGRDAHGGFYERLNAHALMARLTGEPDHWRPAAEAAQALERYLNTGSRGLWHDRRLPDGSFVPEPSPASSFYHIVCAIGELAAALQAPLA